jgi:putative spermidine/putrescine transport system substrate-binding protein
MKRFGLCLVLICLLFSCNPKTPEQSVLSYDQALEKARGTTVNFYMWGGSATINKWVEGYVAKTLEEKYKISLHMVPMDAAVFVNKLLTEKQAGKTNGTIDVMWINGENFKNAREADLLYGPVADKLPNFKNYIDPGTVASDFGFPVDNYEVPYGKAQFVFIHDSAKIQSPPESFAALKQWIISHPGRFSYPQPPDFTGSAFIRQAFYAVTGGHEQYMKGFDEDLYLKKSPALWAYLNEIKPYLWQQGRSYPKNVTALGLLFERGEVDMNMSYHQAYASSKIMEGKYPPTVRTFVMKEGAIYNNHFTAIAFNSSNIAGAMVVTNFLLSPEAQLSKNNPENWGDFTVLDMKKLEPADRRAFDNLDLGEATLALDVLNQHGVPEIPADYLTRLENDWSRFVLEKK